MGISYVISVLQALTLIYVALYSETGQRAR